MKTASTSSSEGGTCSGRAPPDLCRTSDSDRGGLRGDSRAGATGRRRWSNRGIQERAHLSDRPRVLLGWPNLLRGERHWGDPYHLSREPDAVANAILHPPEHGEYGRAGSARPRARSRISRDPVPVCLPDVQRPRERDGLQSDCPDPGEREYGTVTHRDPPDATPGCDDP